MAQSISGAWACPDNRLTQMCVKGENMDDGEVKKHYISEITEMISKINDAGTLEYLHTFIKLFLKKWG